MSIEISLPEEVLTRIKRLRRSPPNTEQDTILDVLKRAIYHLEHHEILQVTWDDKIVLDRPSIPAVREAMLSGELTRNFDWLKEWREPQE